MADKVVRIFDLGMEYKGKRGAAAKGDGARAAFFDDVARGRDVRTYNCTDKQEMRGAL